MDDELKRLVNTVIQGSECYICDSPIEVRARDFQYQHGDLYATEYYCPGCDVGYDVEVVKEDMSISFKAFRMDSDIDVDLAEVSSISRIESLHRQSHPARDLVENTMELVESLDILNVNHDRLLEASETIRKEGFRQDVEFHRNVKTDLHNYMASAYSFEQIVDNIEGQLPTDSSVESAREEFKQEHQIIKGLRTYAQHHLSLPYSFSEFQDENICQRVATITVSLNEVADFDYGDSDISYEDVDGDRINIERRANSHFSAAENLVEEMLQYVESTHREELEDFREATTYPELE